MKQYLFLCILLLTFNNLIAQTEKESAKTVWLLLESEPEIVTLRDGRSSFRNVEYQDFLEKAAIQTIQKAFPYSKNDTLKRLYEVSCAPEKIPILLSDKRIKDVHVCPKYETVLLYDPSDPAWSQTTDSTGLWHLKKIQADKAWDITQGDPSVKIAIIDTWFDINHPDLKNQMYCSPYSSSCIYDPYDYKCFYSDGGGRLNHGTMVAGFAAATTNGGGDLASVGFNCKIIPYKEPGSSSLIQRAQHASLAMDANVLSVSVGSCVGTNGYQFDTYDSLAVREILDNGTAIVVPAGNGWSDGAHCALDGELVPFGPFHPHYDDRIIIVSGTDKNDKHTVIRNGVDRTLSHFSSVDICAPGWEMMGITPTVQSDGTPISWPYANNLSGSSFSAPIVAGVCALMKSINKNLTPAEIQEIIKSTADPIVDAHLYPGQLGAGRINAYKAVQRACELAPVRNFTDQTVSTNTTVTTVCSDIYVENIYSAEGSNTNITIETPGKVTIKGSFKIPAGSSLKIKK